MPNHRKLTPEQVLHIRRRELTQREYARIYKVGRSTIEETQARKRYADVPDPDDYMTVAWLIRKLSAHPGHALLDPDTLSIDVIGEQP